MLYIKSSIYIIIFIFTFFNICIKLIIRGENMKINIIHKLKEANLSRYELAKRIGITYPTIDKIYKGNSTSIKFDILEQICKILECTPNDILTSDDLQMQQLLLNFIPRSSTNKSDTLE